MERVDELRLALQTADPIDLARHIGGRYVEIQPGVGELSLQFWGQEVLVSFPGLIAYNKSKQELNAALQALMVYHFHTTDGVPSGGEFISFSELPDGKFYAQAFQGYTGEELRRAFGDDQLRFERASQVLGGRPYPLGNVAYAFQFLPRLPLLAVFWMGDEDFSSAYQVLFDSAAAHHLPTDACAIAGSMLTRRLIASNT